MKKHPRLPLSRGITLGLIFLGLPASVGAQAGTQAERELEVRQRLEQLLQLQHQERTQQLQEHLERLTEELARVKELDQVREKDLQAELLARSEQVRQRLAEVDNLDQERIREREQRVRELREQSRTLEAERQRTSRLVTERLQGRVEELRARAERDAQRMQQVVVRMRSRVRLGVSLDPSQGADYDRQGARIQSVMEESPAEEAGLLEGDIITHLDGRSLLSSIPNEAEQDFDSDESLPVQRLMALASDLDDGQEVEVRFLRGDEARSVDLVARDMDEPMVLFSPGETEGRIRTLRIRPGENRVWHFEGPDDEAFDFDLRVLPDLKGLDSLRISRPGFRFFTPGDEDFQGMVIREGEGPSNFAFFGRSGRFGLTLTELNAGLGEYFSSDQGVLVLNVEENSSTGLEAGDVILSIGGRTVDDQQDVVRILSSYEEGETVSFSIVRRGQTRTVEGSVR